MEFGVLLRLVRLVGLMILIFILSCSISIQGTEFYLCDFCNKNFNIGLYSDTYEQISCRLGVMMEITKLYSDTSLDDLNLHLTLQFCEESKTSVPFCSQIF